MNVSATIVQPPHPSDITVSNLSVPRLTVGGATTNNSNSMNALLHGKQELSAAVSLPYQSTDAAIPPLHHQYARATSGAQQQNNRLQPANKSCQHLPSLSKRSSKSSKSNC